MLKAMSLKATIVIIASCLDEFVTLQPVLMFLCAAAIVITMFRTVSTGTGVVGSACCQPGQLLCECLNGCWGVFVFAASIVDSHGAICTIIPASSINNRTMDVPNVAKYLPEFHSTARLQSKRNRCSNHLHKCTAPDPRSTTPAIARRPSFTMNGCCTRRLGCGAASCSHVPC